jgi:cation/acetate symporter
VIYEPSFLAIAIFGVIVAATLVFSFWLAAQAKSAQGYFAAGGQIPWFVNGVAFAGDYLSAASFLGICGMIAFYGYDGFLYSIGYLAGWVVALLVVAEPLKRMGKFTFADALDAEFHSRGVKLAAAASTLLVSVFYLIPQMVGAGALIQPLFGLPHWVGVIAVGAVVIAIVVTAGMVSTTYVQFIKGSLLVIVGMVLVGMILNRGHRVQDFAAHLRLFPQTALLPEPPIGPIQLLRMDPTSETLCAPSGETVEVLPATGDWKGKPYLRARNLATGKVSVFGGDPHVAPGANGPKNLFVLAVGDHPAALLHLPSVRQTSDGRRDVDMYPVGGMHAGVLALGSDSLEKPAGFLSDLDEMGAVVWRSEVITGEDGSKTTVCYPVATGGSILLTPGNHPSFAGLRGDKLVDKINFLSLMLALFAGTASLPHILIRYYTVKDQAAARKSTVVGIGTIGLFYVLTLFIGLGAMTSGALDPTNSNMAAPLLARSFGEVPFAVVSAVAFTTVLGTVSGLIIAAGGAVAHDLMANVLRIEMTDGQKVRAGKITAVAVGGVAVVLGILFERMNVNYLVGWAFSVAASANLPALAMLLFWPRTTKQGVVAAVTVGMLSSLGWILLSGDTFKDVYGLPAASSPVPFSQPGIVTIPLGFAVLVAVSLMTRPKTPPPAA